MGREAHHPTLGERFAGPPPSPPKDPTPLEAMDHRLKPPEGKKLYALRKQIPEPVFYELEHIRLSLAHSYRRRSRRCRRALHPDPANRSVGQRATDRCLSQTRNCWNSASFAAFVRLLCIPALV